MKKLLFLFDTDEMPSVFDTVVGYDGGADHVTGYANVTPDNVGALIDGTIYTRGGKDKQNTAIFVGGGNMTKGEELYEKVKKSFFGPFRVSVMLDSNGSNTTAAAGVALLAKAKSLKGKKALVLAGTGPVGMRAAGFLGMDGADVTITSRTKDRAEAAKDANVIFAAGAIGIQLLPESAWKDNPNVELLADVNAQPPLGVEGIQATDKGAEYGDKIAFGALGLGGLKLKLHRACIAKMFESAEAVFDAEEIYALAKEMA